MSVTLNHPTVLLCLKGYRNRAAQRRTTVALGEVQGIMKDIGYYRTISPPDRDTCLTRSSSKKKLSPVGGQNLSYEKYKAARESGRYRDGKLLPGLDTSKPSPEKMQKMRSRRKTDEVPRLLPFHHSYCDPKQASSGSRSSLCGLT